MVIMTRFQIYALLLLFGMCALLLQTGIPYSWRYSHFHTSKDSIENEHNYNIFQRKSKSINDGKDQKLDEQTKKQIFDNSKNKIISPKMLINRKSIKSLQFIKDMESYPPWSYDRFMANMTLFINQKRDQKELHTLLSSAFNPLNALPVIPQNTVSRILLFAYFRSGSTFLGDLLQQNWKSFYTFEPLHFMSDGVRIEDDRVKEAHHLIEKIFRCDFEDLKYYVEWVKKTRNQFLFKWNKFLWGICRFRIYSCFDTNFIQQTCLRAKVQIMKVARLQMRHLETLLPKINDLNVRIVYLVRDPRGTLKSRQNMMWCSKKSNCSDISSLCSEMRQDLNSFKQFKKIYPSRFTLVKYEDLSTDPNTYAKQLLDQFSIPYSASVKRFLKVHTNSRSSDYSKRNPYTTIRNSKSVAYEWMQTLNMTDILQVQNTCGDLLQELGYKFIVNNNTIAINITETKLKL